MKIFTLLSLFFILFIAEIKVLAQAPTISLSQVISGLSLPIQLVNAGDGSNRIFIVEKAGAIKVFDKSYAPLGVFLTVASVRSIENERGLLSMVFHPDYKNNGFFYVYFTNTNGNLELDRYKVSSDANMADPSSRDTLIIIPHPTNNNHNGGELHFGNDGYLYLSTGDGGGSNDLPNNSQNTSVLLGKMLRFNVNTSDIKPYYTLPLDNPFGNEVFAYGLRNPFRWSFDKLTYDMWIGDVGQDAFEEVNFRGADSTNGVNYGWRCYEGLVPKNTTGCGPIANYTFPIYTYPTTAATSISITGGTVYRGSTYIDLQGYYIACEYYTGNYFKIKSTGLNTWDTSTQKLTLNKMADFGETEDGELYTVALESGKIYRILATGSVQYSFTGNGNWTDANNWSNNTLPPSILPSGSEIIIDPVSNGECVLNVTQTIAAGAKLIVKNDRQFRVLGDLTIQ